ncbi:hypothetical protein Y032_0064g3553 [Ancylostoma ceylanicum]|uniref:Uncharacterized protein n=1 Tax=Ancylostoma ceylanicum TaxID=53326 RepID=A0A016U2I9_9BILA|nr:hypothetical protein Y032_0064g3553 [Ancylostoma ceylanicum]
MSVPGNEADLKTAKEPRRKRVKETRIVETHVVERVIQEDIDSPRNEAEKAQRSIESQPSTAKSTTKPETDSSSSVVTETSGATSHETSKAKSVPESANEQSEQNPMSPMVAKGQKGLNSVRATLLPGLEEYKTSRAALLPLDDDIKTARKPTLSEREGLRTARLPSPLQRKRQESMVLPSRPGEADMHTATLPTEHSKASPRKKVVVEREVIERRQIERILTEEEGDPNKIAADGVAADSGQVQQGQAVPAEQEALLSRLPPLPPLGALVDPFLHCLIAKRCIISHYRTSPKLIHDLLQVGLGSAQGRDANQWALRGNVVQNPAQQGTDVPELMDEEAQLRTAEPELRTAENPTEYTARSPSPSFGRDPLPPGVHRDSESDPQNSKEETHIVDVDAQQLDRYRYRFVKPMVVLADINGKIYRLTTHYTIETDRPHLDFKPLTIKFDGQLLWEKYAELSQKIELDTVTSCSTGHGTVTEKTPIHSG